MLIFIAVLNNHCSLGIQCGRPRICNCLLNTHIICSGERIYKLPKFNAYTLKSAQYITIYNTQLSKLSYEYFKNFTNLIKVTIEKNNYLCFNNFKNNIFFIFRNNAIKCEGQAVSALTTFEWNPEGKFTGLTMDTVTRGYELNTVQPSYNGSLYKEKQDERRRQGGRGTKCNRTNGPNDGILYGGITML